MEQRPLWLALALDGVLVLAFAPPVNFFVWAFLDMLVYWGGQGFLLVLETLALGVTGVSFGMFVYGMLRGGAMSRETKEYLVKLSGLILFGTFFAVNIGLAMMDSARMGCDPAYDPFSCILAQVSGYLGPALLLTPVVPIGTIGWVLLRSTVSLVSRRRRTLPQLTLPAAGSRYSEKETKFARTMTGNALG